MITERRTSSYVKESHSDSATFSFFSTDPYIETPLSEKVSSRCRLPKKLTHRLSTALRNKLVSAELLSAEMGSRCTTNGVTFVDICFKDGVCLRPLSLLDAEMLLWWFMKVISSKPHRSHRAQTGRLSSHFMRRLRHVEQPLGLPPMFTMFLQGHKIQSGTPIRRSKRHVLIIGKVGR